MRITADTTAADVVEAMGHMLTSARQADKAGNVIAWAIAHRHLDDALDTYEVLSALEGA